MPDATLVRIVESRPEPVVSAEPLSDAIGVPGVAAVQQNTALATAVGPSGVRLRLLDAPSSSESGARAGVLMPLDDFQQAHAVIGMSASGGVAAAVATKGILHPGEWRLLGVVGDKIVLDRDVPGYVARAEGAPDAAVCLSPDGNRIAFVLPAHGETAVIVGRPDRLHTVHLAATDQIQACDVESSGVTLAAYGANNALKLTTIAENGDTTARRPVSERVNSVQFCPGTGTAVLQGAQGAIISHANGKVDRIPSAIISGCTTTGTPWFVGHRTVSWLRTQ
jgi:hypothetical protein